MIARSVPAPANHHRGSYTSPALATASYPFVDLPPGNTLRRKLFPSSKFYNRSLYFSETMRYNEVNDKLEFVEAYSMIGFSIMMWFISLILIFLGVSLLKGNYSSVHGKVFDTTNDKEGYAKELGKPTLLIGIGLLISGIIAVILRHDYSIIVAAGFLLLIVVIAGIWFYKVQKRFS